MSGVGGKHGWSWIFILEGLATVLVGVASFWMVFDFPDEATFLSPDDRRRVIRRLKVDQQSSAEHEDFKMSYFWDSVKDWKTYMYMIIYMGADGPLYAFSLFLPSIISAVSISIFHPNHTKPKLTFHSSATNPQLLSSSPFPPTPPPPS